MNSNKFLIICTLAVVAILAGHLSQSFTLKELVPADGKEAEPNELVGIFRMVNVLNLDEEPPCKYCDGFTQEGCKRKCNEYQLPKAKCYGCMCLCEM